MEYAQALTKWQEAEEDPAPAMPHLELHGAAGIAVEALFSRAAGEARDKIVKLMAQPAFIASEGLSHLDLSSPDVLAGLGALAALDLNAHAKSSSQMMAKLGLPSMQSVPPFTSWAGRSNGALAYFPEAADLDAQVLMGARGLLPNAAARLQLAAAIRARACSNVEFAERLILRARRVLGEVDNASDLLLAELSLLQLQQNGSSAVANDASRALAGLLSGGSDDAREPLESAAVRVKLTAALHPPSALTHYVASSPLDAHLWWSYAQHMHSTTREARRASCASGGPLEPAQIEGYAAAFTGCCRALITAPSETLGQGGLPAVLTLLR